MLSRSCALLALMLLSCAARAEDVMSADVGGTSVRFPVPDGYVRTSVQEPQFFNVASASMTPQTRLIEALVTPDALDPESEVEESPRFMYAVVRQAEPMTLSAAQWEEGLPIVARTIGGLDLNAVADDLGDGAAERMGKAADADVNLEFGEIAKPRVYSQAGGVVRFAVKVPMKLEIEGTQVEQVLDCATAMLVLNGKLVMIAVYTPADAADTQFQRARTLLDELVQRADALNEGTIG